MEYQKPEEGAKWGDSIPTPASLSDIASPFGAQCFANNRHLVTIHFHNVTEGSEHTRFLEKVLERSPNVSARTISDGSLIMQMSTREFEKALGGQTLNCGAAPSR